MKKIVLSLFAVAIAALSATAQGTSPSATKQIYDFTGFGDKQLLDLFYNALQQGRNYPTVAEFEAAGIQASDIAFVRSHVRPRSILDRSDRLVEKTYEKRELWMNIPMNIGSGNDAGYPTAIWTSDVFSMWNYTNLFGSWNHSIFQAPGCWVDAAHKNGSDIMSGIKFFESWNTGDGTYSSMITQKNSDGTFKYVKPMINCLMFFGSDGINYNWEDGSYSKADVIAFHKELYKEAAAQGFDNFHIGIYTSNSALSNNNVNALLGTKETGKTADVMLNYSGGDFSYEMGSSVDVAEQKWGSSEGLYAGVWIVSMDRSWDDLDEDWYSGSDSPHRCSLCLWGEHGQSRFMSYNSGNGPYEMQANYQRLLERGFSGGNRNPLTRPTPSKSGNNWELQGTKLPLQSFCGLAEFIPERSAIQGDLPFQTHFNLGNGDRYLYKGKRTAGEWYNMANQDIVPTYRWLTVKAGTMTPANNLTVEFSHDDAYTGGSCLVVRSKVSEPTDIILYKTNLKANGKVKVKLALKDAFAADKTHNAGAPSVIVRKQNGQWVEATVAAPEKNGAWVEREADIALSAGDVIDRIGLRVNGTYDCYVGKLEISDDTKTTPANVSDLVVEVKEETTKSLSVKLNWNVEATAKTRAAWDLVYNDEANIDHFEILYKNGENGRVSEIGRTSQWAAFVGNIFFESADDKPFIGVRSAATDMKTYSPVVWVEVPRANPSSLPALEEEDTYGISEMDPKSENAETARQIRYLTDVTTTGATQNINYHTTSPVEGENQHVDARDQILKVKQGQTIQLYVKAFDTTNNHPGSNSPDGLRYCLGGAWIDLNGSGTFDHPNGITAEYDGDTADPLGERIFKIGSIRGSYPEIETQGSTFTFKVPEDAHTGKSRLRIVFSDAWFPNMFMHNGLFAKGYSIDFGVEISGDNTNQRTFVDTHDAGVADEPEGLGTTAISDNTLAKGVSSVAADNGQLTFTNVEKAWIYTVDGSLVSFVNNSPKRYSTANMKAGVYIVKMQNRNVIRTQKIFVK